jgi:hypothetical protein
MCNRDKSDAVELPKVQEQEEFPEISSASGIARDFTALGGGERDAKSCDVQRGSETHLLCDGLAPLPDDVPFAPSEAFN